MIQQSVILSVPDMIDLAVGPPELNIGLLNVLLHIIANQIKVDSVRVQLNTTSPPPANQRTKFEDKIKQFSVEDPSPDGELDLKQCKLHPHIAMRPRPVKTLLVVGRNYDAVSSPMALRKKDLHENCMPSADELVEASQGDEGKTLVQMIDLLNISKRVEATELLIEKVMQCLCECSKKNLASSADKTNGDGEDDKEQCKELRKMLKNLREDMALLELRLDEINCVTKDLTKRVEALEDAAEVANNTCSIKNKHGKHKNDNDGKIIRDSKHGDGGKHSVVGKNASSDGKHGVDGKNADDGRNAGGADGAGKTVCPVRPGGGSSDAGGVAGGAGIVWDTANDSTDSNDDYTISRSSSNSGIVNLEEFVNQLKAQLEAALSKVQQDICIIQNQLDAIHKSINDLIQNFNAARETLLDFAVTFEEVKRNLEALNIDMNLLVQERIDRRRQYEALIDQLEAVKCMKADRDEVQLMVDAKADIVDMNKKVPYDIFDDVHKDFSLMQIQLFEKIIQTNHAWQQAIEGLVEILATKVDQNNADLMATMMLDRMVALKDKLREFGMFRMSCESAATSEKYLKDVKCLTCNAQTYMNPKLGLPEIPRLGRFGEKLPDRSSKESRTFARITVPCSQKTNIECSHKVKRFCGGKHTELRPEERNSKKGNFIIQTGAVPAGSNIVLNRALGTDGVLYYVDISQCTCQNTDVAK